MVSTNRRHYLLKKIARLNILVSTPHPDTGSFSLGQFSIYILANHGSCAGFALPRLWPFAREYGTKEEIKARVVTDSECRSITFGLCFPLDPHRLKAPLTRYRLRLCTML